MSAEQDISSVVASFATDSSEKDKATVELALQEVRNLLLATHDSMIAICADVEKAASKKVLRQAFQRLNGIVGIFLALDLAPENEALLLDAITSLEVSGRLAA